MTQSFTRGFYQLNAQRSGPKYAILPGNVGYIDFDRLEPSEVAPVFEALKNTRAIVLDNRGYPRGAVVNVATRLTTERSLPVALFDTPSVVEPLDGRLGDSQPIPMYHEFMQTIDGGDVTSKYQRPTVMLIDERALSQSEHSALFLRAAGHTRFVGTPTQGANGDVTSMLVPGAVALYFTGEGVRYADGTRLQRLGVLPDVRVEPTAVDVQQGNDVVLQRGLGEALRLAGIDAASRTQAVQREQHRERESFAAVPARRPVEVAGTAQRQLELPWAAGGAGYSGSSSADNGYRGAAEIVLQSSGAGVAGPFGLYSAALDIAEYRGKTVRIRGYLRAENVSGGAGFWLRVDGPHRQFDNMHDRWLLGTQDWTPFEIVLTVPDDATKAITGLILNGTGSVHASGMMIDIVPNTTPTTNDRLCTGRRRYGALA